MKLNFRKIASVLSSAVMVSSTVALAAAATYPAPFVQNGQGMVGVVFGSSAGGQLDSPAAVEIAESLSGYITSTSSGGSTTVTGESYTIKSNEDDPSDFSLGYGITNFEDTLTDEHLATVLGDGRYKSKSDSYDYTQEIELANLTLSYMEDADEINDEIPFIGMDVSDSNILTYTLDFDTPVDGALDSGDLEDITDTNIKILGKDYYIAAAEVDSSGDFTLELLDSANSQTLLKGESVTVPVNGKNYEITLSSVIDNDSPTPDEAVFVVNGETLDSDLSKGDVEEIDDDVYLAVQRVRYYSASDGTSEAKFSIGAGKLFLENGAEVKLNDKSVSSSDYDEKYGGASVYSYLSNNTFETLDKIILEWNTSSDTYVFPGHEIILPGFETIKYTMGEFMFPDDAETTKVEGGDDALQIKTEGTDGPVTLEVLATDSGQLSAIGRDADDRINTVVSTAGGTETISFNKNVDEWFVGTYISGDEAQSYLFQVDKPDNETGKDTKVTIRSVGGDSKTINVGDSASFGKVKVLVSNADEGSQTATIQLTSSNTYADRWVTPEGLTIYLPVNTSAVTGPNAINWSNAGSISGLNYTFYFSEENDDGDISYGSNFTAKAVWSSTQIDISSVSPSGYETEPDSDVYQSYVSSALGTKLLVDKSGDINKLEIQYAGEQTAADVMIAESGALVSMDDSTETGKVVPVYDNELDKVAGKNLIVVGGSCVNTLAASLLGSATPLCGAAWEAKTQVGAGQFLIQTFSRDGGKVATLVAGYNLEDTKNAVKALKTDKTIDISAGKAFKGTVSGVQALTVA